MISPKTVLSCHQKEQFCGNGGVLREENTVIESKTPWLGDLPYVGNLFKRTSRESRRNELLIFITPKMIAEIALR